MLAAFVLPATASAASVTPTVIAGNSSCADLNPGWTGLKIDRQNVAGDYSDGTLSVHVVQAKPGGNFDWSTNIGVDVVLVKGGTDTNEYLYNPESTGDTNLSPPDTFGLSHVEFCYDTNDDTPPPPPPACNDTSATTAANTPVDMSLPCSGSPPVSCSIVDMPQNGTLGTVNGCTVTYTPPSGCSGGQDSFTYEATDANGTSNVATATVTITPCSPPPPKPPVCEDTSATTAAGTPVEMSLPCSGTGENLSCSIVGMPAHGTLGDVNGCAVTYTPNSDVACSGGQDTFTYEATDSNGTSNVATGTVTVMPASGCGGGTNNDTPPNNAPALQGPAAFQAPADQPGGAQLVLGERVSGGTAKLLAASGCSGRPFNARVRGASIARVVFYLDGKRVATMTKPNRSGLFSLRVSPQRMRVGVHRLIAKVTFTAASGTAPRTLRASFQRCAQRLIAPRFTG